MATEFLMESNSVKKTSQGTFLPSLVQIGPVVWEEKMFTELVDDAGRKTDDAMKDD